MRDAYSRGSDRDEQQRLPPRLEDFVDRDNAVRVVDAFVDGMSSGDAQGALPEERVMEGNGGRPSYSPRAMVKLFIWGYINRRCSTRRLEKECPRNTELIWLINGLRPDHSSISRFRATNSKRIATLLKEFNLLTSASGLFGRKELVIDATLLKAVNAKKHNHTSGTIARTLEKIEKRISAYLDELEQSESAEDNEDVSKVTS